MTEELALSRVECVKCRGTGWASVPPPRCGNCIGVGNTTCEQCDGRGEYRCEDCDGTGVTDCIECFGDSLLICERCDGLGMIGKMVKVKCPRCSGLGKVNGLPCTRCSATGNVEKEPDKCEDCNGSGQMKCSNCVDGKEDCEYCRLGSVKCEVCEGTGKSTCPYCDGTGKAGKQRLFRCDICRGEGYKDLVIASSGTPDLGHIQQMIAAMYAKMEEGRKLTESQLMTISRRLEQGDRIDRASIEEVTEKFTSVELALQELKRLKRDVIQESTETVEVKLACPGCGYYPTGTIAEDWMTAADYSEPVQCFVCFTTFKIQER